MAKTIRTPVAATTQPVVDKRWVYNRNIEIFEQRATDSKPQRLNIRGTDEATPYNAGTPLALLDRLQKLSEETGLEIDYWAVRYPEAGKPRLEQPMLRFNKYGPYLSFIKGEAKEKPANVSNKPKPRVWR